MQKLKDYSQQYMGSLIAKSMGFVSNGVVITDATKKDNPIIFVNKAFEEITGYPPKEVLGKNCRFLQGQDTKQPELDKLRKAIKQEKDVYVILKNYKKDGTLFYNELHIAPIKDNRGKTMHFIGIQNDVTKRVRAEQELQRYQQDLENRVEERTKDMQVANAQLQAEIADRQQAYDKLTTLYARMDAQVRRTTSGEEKNIRKNEQNMIQMLLKARTHRTTDIAKDNNTPVSTMHHAVQNILEKKLMQKIVLPNYMKLGLKVMSIIYYALPRSKHVLSKQDEKEFSRWRSLQPGIIYNVHSTHGGFLLCMHDTWEDINTMLTSLHQQNLIHLRHYRRFEIIHFPLEGAHINAWFDFVSQQKHEANENKLNQTHLKVLWGMAKYPDMSMSQLHKRLEMSAPTCLKAKNKLISKGLAQQRFFPNLLTLHKKKLLVLLHIPASRTHIQNAFVLSSNTSVTVAIKLYDNYVQLQDEIELLPQTTFALTIPLQEGPSIVEDFASAVKKRLS